MSATHLDVHWNLTVSRNTDTALRQFLASQPEENNRNLSHFVEEAVQIHLFDLTAMTIKIENAAYSQIDIENTINEALNWTKS